MLVHRGRIGQSRRIVEPPFRTFRTTDSDRLVEALRNSSLQPCQLSRGPATSQLSRVLFPGSCLDLAEFGPAMQFSGVTPRDCYALLFVLKCPEPGRSFNFEVEHGVGYMGVFAPAAPLDAFTPAGYCNAALTLPTDAFHAFLASSRVQLPDSVLGEGGALRIGPGEQRTIHSLASAIGEMIRDPAGPLADEAVRQSAERSVRAAFLAALTSPDTQTAFPDCVRITRRYHRLRLAREYVAAHVHKPVSIDNLCNATGLGRRALENLFKDLLGLCPTTYLRNLRLQGTRHALLRATPTSASVKSIALDWGFWHLGRFSAYYHGHFGEHPSKTLTTLSQRLY